MNQERPNNAALTSRRKAAVPSALMNLHETFAVQARNALVRDADGREWIDLTAGLGVCNVGHAHPKVAQAVAAQAETFTHTCFHLFMYEGYVELAERLCALAPGDFSKKAALFNSGAEAVENAVKAARVATGRPAALCFDDNFHGRTLLTMSLTSKVAPVKQGFGPFAPETHRVPFAYCYRCPVGKTYPACDVACVELVREAFVTRVAAESTACVVVEPVTGQGGHIVPPPEYFPRLREICDAHGVLLILDEIQAGMGRTGTMFAIEHWDVAPDLVAVAKSLAGGLPLSAVVGRADVLDAVQTGGLGSTFGGNPVACAAANAVLDVFETEDLLAKARAVGETVAARFAHFAESVSIVGEARGLGAMQAVELVSDRQARTPAPELAKEVIGHCLREGVVALAQGRHGNVVRILPPLTISEEALMRGLDVMEDALRQASKK